jgi:hypothetical protein
MKRLLLLLGLLCVNPGILAEEVKNPLFDDWVKEGIRIPNGPLVKLPAPLLRPGQATKIDEALLEKAADRVPLELFLKRSVAAPFFLRINSIENDDQQRCGQMISLRFVAYGKLTANALQILYYKGVRAIGPAGFVLNERDFHGCQDLRTR